MIKNYEELWRIQYDTALVGNWLSVSKGRDPILEKEEMHDDLLSSQPSNEPLCKATSENHSFLWKMQVHIEDQKELVRTGLQILHVTPA